ncbi:IS4 family transposase [soil metagenome]
MGLFRRNKNNDRPLFRQIIDLIPRYLIKKSVDRYEADKHCSRYLTYDQLVSQMFGQLNKCYTLEDISAGLGVSLTFIGDLGLSQSPARSTMSDGNKKRDWRVFEHLYLGLLRHYRGVLKAKHLPDKVIRDIENKTVRVIDSTTVSLCLPLFDWARFRTAKGGVKIHTCLDSETMLPDVVNITEAKVHDSKGLAQQVFKKGDIIVEDRAYYEFALMKARIEAGNDFVTRIKDNACYEVVAIRPLPEDAPEGVIADVEIHLTGAKAVESGMAGYALRMVTVYDAEKGKTLELITNNFDWKAETVGALYRHRWSVEVFFKTLKQNLQVKTFTGTSPNAVKSQIYIALICYLLLELLRRNTCRVGHAFSNFTERVRICLNYYLSLDYVCNNICQGAKRVDKRKPPDLFSGQSDNRTSKTNTLRLTFT